MVLFLQGIYQVPISFKYTISLWNAFHSHFVFTYVFAFRFWFSRAVIADVAVVGVAGEPGIELGRTVERIAWKTCAEDDY